MSKDLSLTDTLNSTNTSLAYDISFDNDFSFSVRSHLKSTPKHVISTHPNISKCSNTSRFSEIFRHEMTTLGLSENSNDSSVSNKENIFSPNVSNLSLDLDLNSETNKSLICINKSLKNPIIDAEISINSELSIDDKLDNSQDNDCILPKSNRYSELFRTQLSHLDLESPDNTLDILEQIKVNEPSEVFSLDLSIEDSVVKNQSDQDSELSLDLEQGEKSKSRVSEFFRTEMSHLCISSPDISFDLPKICGEDNDLSLGARDVSVGTYEGSNDGQLKNIKKQLDNSSTIESDSENTNEILTVNITRSRRLLDSDSEDEVSVDIERSQILNDSADNNDDSTYKSEYDDSFIDDANCKVISSSDDETEASSYDSSDEDCSPVHKKKIIPTFKTPRTSHNSYVTPSNIYMTPVTGNKRKTCIATPLSVNTKTGTPGAPNRVFKRNFLSVAKELYQQFNDNVFNNQLPSTLEIKINKRLNTTAGRCVYLRKKEIYCVYIELSPKVVDCLERLKETLAHEMCHAAAFIIDHKMDQHGPIWKKWAKRTNVKYPELPPVSRCHSYEIKYKFNYNCIEDWCSYKIGRHSKSIKLETARCPLCYSGLELDKDSIFERTPNSWMQYVKSNYSEVKAKQPAIPHRDLMKELSKQFQQAKLQQTC